MNVSDGQREIYICDVFSETIIPWTEERERTARPPLDKALLVFTDEFLLEPLVHILRCDKTEFLFKSLIPFVEIQFN